MEIESLDCGILPVEIKNGLVRKIPKCVTTLKTLCHRDRIRCTQFRRNAINAITEFDASRPRDQQSERHRLRVPVRELSVGRFGKQHLPPTLGKHRQSFACYREFKQRCQTLMEMLPEESPFVFGMACFILGNVLARSTSRLFHLIERHREESGDDPSTKDSVDFLREE